MKMQLKITNYLSPNERHRIEVKDKLKHEWEREKNHFIPSCDNCKRRFSCLLYKNGYYDERFKCLKRRVYLMYKFGYNLFNIKPNTIGYELGLKEFFRRVKVHERIEKYEKEYNSGEQVNMLEYLKEDKLCK